MALTSFGGPIAHIGYFRDEYVARRGWLNDARFGELVALCQFLPGPASSQLGIAIGLQRAGHAGALAAWIGFTLPSAAVLILFAYGLQEFGGQGGEWLSGLKIVVVAVVAHALWGHGQIAGTGQAAYHDRGPGGSGSAFRWRHRRAGGSNRRWGRVGAGDPANGRAATARGCRPLKRSRAGTGRPGYILRTAASVAGGKLVDRQRATHAD